MAPASRIARRVFTGVCGWVALLASAGCESGWANLQQPPDASGAHGECIVINGPRFSLSPLPASAPELPNPGRGFFRWRGVETAPVATYDAYQRYRWADLEPTQGVYDFSRIDNDIALAASKGQRFAFRVQAVSQGDGTRQFPSYLPAACSSNGLDVPDWNSNLFIGRATQLFLKLAERYNHDDRISYIDIGMYGNWAEWHTGGLCGTPATLASKQKYVDLQVDAFNNKPFTMNSGASEVDAFVYALSKSSRVGVRCDSLGDPWFDEQFTRYPAKLAAMAERWKTAPFVAEFFGSDQTHFDTAAEQVKRWHVALVGNGNVGTNGAWSEMSAATQGSLLSVGKGAGYRFVLRELGFSSTPAIGGTVSVVTRWSNLGVTPAYEPWTASIQLRRLGAIALELPLGIDFQALLPTARSGSDAPVSRADALAVPSALRGTYDVHIVVQSRGTGTQVLRLANGELQPDGSVKVGSITLSDTAPSTVSSSSQVTAAGDLGPCGS